MFKLFEKLMTNKLEKSIEHAKLEITQKINKYHVKQTNHLNSIDILQLKHISYMRCQSE